MSESDLVKLTVSRADTRVSDGSSSNILNHTVRDCLKCEGDSGVDSVGISVVNGVDVGSLPGLSESISVLQSEGSSSGGINVLDLRHNSNIRSTLVVKRISSSGAQTLVAISTGVSRVTDTSLVLQTIPKLVRSGSTATQSLGSVVDVTANSVSRARVGAHGTLASTSLVSVKADTLSGSAVTQSLVRALHVGMSLIVGGKSRVQLESSRGGSHGGDLSIDSKDSNTSIVVQISLSSINESNSELANSLRAVISHPVTVASTCVVCTTESMSRAHVVALSGSIGSSKSHNSNG
jgi:hypothetical protein